MILRVIPFLYQDTNTFLVGGENELLTVDNITGLISK